MRVFDCGDYIPVTYEIFKETCGFEARTAHAVRKDDNWKLPWPLCNSCILYGMGGNRTRDNERPIASKLFFHLPSSIGGSIDLLCSRKINAGPPPPALL